MKRLLPFLLLLTGCAHHVMAHVPGPTCPKDAVLEIVAYNGRALNVCASLNPITHQPDPNAVFVPQQYNPYTEADDYDDGEVDRSNKAPWWKFWSRKDKD